MNESGIPPETFFLILNLLSSQHNVFAKSIGALEQELVRMLRFAISLLSFWSRMSKGCWVLFIIGMEEVALPL